MWPDYRRGPQIQQANANQNHNNIASAPRMVQGVISNNRVPEFWTAANPYNRAYFPEEVGDVINRKDVFLNQEQKEMPALFFFSDD